MEASADFIAACLRTGTLGRYMDNTALNLTSPTHDNQLMEVVRTLIEDFAGRAIALTIANVDGPLDMTAPDCRARIVETANAVVDAHEEELMSGFYASFKAAWPRREPGFWGGVKLILARFRHRRRGLPNALISYGMLNLAVLGGAVALCVLSGLDPELTLKPTEEEKRTYLQAFIDACAAKNKPCIIVEVIPDE